ncbi:hypothetical protein C5167_022191 [Papaver somniferum]|uniref:Nucleotide exchange factor Fes1 domain-containing protein n=1 Tax=Papaver somniferum TaxID=3469 RepID=A0A4Y7JKD9_PAPSO|nr:hypothetical protein C5167_022191 [Papaver somniferum]
MVKLIIVFSSCLIAKEIENNTISNSKFENDNNDNDVVDLEGGGGFPSLDGMLHWAIGHSDPAKLKEAAQSVQSLCADELEIRQQELKLMQIAIANLKNSSLSSEDHHRALQELLHLVELIDNANDLGKLGGIAAVLQELDNSDLQIRITSAWILGKADFAAWGTTKANEDGAIKFSGRGNKSNDIMSNSSIDIRLRKKSASLVADLAESLIESTGEPGLQYFSSRYFLKSVVSLVASADFDLQEKVSCRLVSHK